MHTARESGHPHPTACRSSGHDCIKSPDTDARLHIQSPSQCQDALLYRYKAVTDIHRHHRHRTVTRCMRTFAKHCLECMQKQDAIAQVRSYAKERSRQLSWWFLTLTCSRPCRWSVGHLITMMTNNKDVHDLSAHCMDTVAKTQTVCASNCSAARLLTQAIFHKRKMPSDIT